MTKAPIFSCVKMRLFELGRCEIIAAICSVICLLSTAWSSMMIDMFSRTHVHARKRFKIFYFGWFCEYSVGGWSKSSRILNSNSTEHKYAGFGKLEMIRSIWDSCESIKYSVSEAWLVDFFIQAKKIIWCHALVDRNKFLRTVA